MSACAYGSEILTCSYSLVTAGSVICDELSLSDLVILEITKRLETQF